MKNLKIQIKEEQLKSNTYAILRTNNAYEFFSCEFKSVAKDTEGNILIPGSETRKANSIELLNRIKETIMHQDESIRIPKSSLGYTYFTTEYSYKFPEDQSGVIIPNDSEEKGRVR